MAKAKAKPKTLTRKQRISLSIGALAVFISWVYGVYIIGPLRQEASKLRQQMETAKQKVESLESSTANEAQLRKEYQESQEIVKALRHNLPPEEELPAIMELISGMANQAQVKIETIFPQKTSNPSAASKDATKPPGSTPAGARVYKDVLIQIDALAGYHQLGTFLGLIETSEKPLQVTTLRVVGNPRETKRHNIKLLVRSFFALNDLAAPKNESTPSATK